MCAQSAGNESLTRNGVYVLPCWVVKQNSSEAVGAPGQVVPKRPAGSSVSPITRSETNLGVNVEQSGPVRADEFGPERGDEFGPTDADEDVVQEAEELKHVPAPFCPPKLKWNRTTFRIFHFEAGALRVSVAEDFHLVIAKLTRKRRRQNRYQLSLWITGSSGNRKTERMTHFQCSSCEIARVKESGVTRCRQRV